MCDRRRDGGGECIFAGAGQHRGREDDNVVAGGGKGGEGAHRDSVAGIREDRGGSTGGGEGE